MTLPTAPDEVDESAEAEIELDDTDGVLDLTDRRRVFLQVVFGVDVTPLTAEAVFAASADGE